MASNSAKTMRTDPPRSPEPLEVSIPIPDDDVVVEPPVRPAKRARNSQRRNVSTEFRPSPSTMHVVKRNGRRERVSFDKITLRITKLCYNLDELVDPVIVSQKVVGGLVPGVSTSEIDQSAALEAAQLVNHHPHYAVLAGRLIATDLHRKTTKRFSELVEKMVAFTDAKTGRHMPLVSDELVEITRKYADEIDSAIIHNRDMNFEYFGIKTLMRSYLLKMNDEIVESPQHMYMRVAIGIHGDELPRILETYDLLSRGVLSHASPTMFNAGTRNPQMSSCFLLQLPGDQDSIEDIFQGAKNCAMISKTAGGIGLAVHNVRASGSYIAGTNGTSNGLVPMLRVFNTTARYVDQGGNKRPGAFAIYLEPWHADVFSFLDLPKLIGQEEMRARDLFYALWIPDLFYKRLESDAHWTLMCPKECPGLSKVYGDEFEAKYIQYEREGKGKRVVKAKDLWAAILSTQLETGRPYVLNKDHCNRKNQQKNLGTLELSNLCVSGSTTILTEHGEIEISDMVVAAETEYKKSREAWDEKQALEAQLAKAKAKNPQNKRTLREITDLEGSIDRLPKDIREPGPAPKGKPINVWNGEEWTEVTPTRTSDDPVELIRITTSYGSVLDVTPNHTMIRADNTRCEARELLMGDRLVYSPPIMYPGLVKYDLEDDVAFRRGFVYGYAVQRMGARTTTLGHTMPEASVTVIELDKALAPPELLERLGYDAKTAYKMNPKLPHDMMAYIIIPEADRRVQTRRLARERTRKIWCNGLVAAIGPELGLRSGRAALTGAWRMLRSVGQDVRLRPDGADGAWIMHWPAKKDDPDDTPVVTGIQRVGAMEQTYCVTEPKRNAVVFDGQLTGQCVEILEYTSKDEISVCSLCSIALPRFVVQADDGAPQFDFEGLHAVTKTAVYNMNKIVDRNYYPLKEMMANLKHRPVGIGIQGLADTFAMLNIPWEQERGVPHPEAKLLNVQIAETMYHAALEGSCELARIHGPYESYKGSPMSEGKLQCDLWDVVPSSLWDWQTLRASIAAHGVRNSLLMACMPTASTAQILGNNESFEPFTNNMGTRRVLAGEFQVVNKHLVYRLIDEGLWDREMRRTIMEHNGSIQKIEQIPKDIRELFKTVWEISQKTLIDLSADRGAFVDQSQSFNLHMRAPTPAQLSQAIRLGWKKGLKTSMYYLRTRPAKDPVKVVLDPDNALVRKMDVRFQEDKTDPAAEPDAALMCSLLNSEACEMCSA